MSRKIDRLLPTIRLSTLVFSVGAVCFIGCSEHLPVSLNEKDRIEHPAGFSVIAPNGWHSEVFVLGPNAVIPHQQIVFFSESPSQRRVGTIGALSQLSSEPDLERANRLTFDHVDMYVTYSDVKGSFDDPTRTTVGCFRKAGENWYRLSIQSIANKQDVEELCVQVALSIREVQVSDGAP